MLSSEQIIICLQTSGTKNYKPSTCYAEYVDPQLICPYCKSQVSQTFIFCPTCGKNLKVVQNQSSLGKLLGTLFLCVFLPPFGLIPAIKYLKQDDQNAKRLGVLALTLTIISTVVTIWISLSLINQISQTASSLSL